MKEELIYNRQDATAIDLYTAVPQHQGLPEEAPLPQQEKLTRVRAKTTVAPFAVVGFLTAVALLLLVMLGYVQLYEESTRNAELADTLSDLREQNIMLVNQYETQVDLTYIEKAAMDELGMQKALPDQSVYVDLSNASDGGVILSPQGNTGMLQRFFQGIGGTIADLMAYLR